MATDRAGNPGPWSAPITVIKDTVAPKAPATLTAKAVPGVIILTWDAVADAVSYRIYRDGTHIAVEVTTTYTDTYRGLVPGVTYHYEVKAVDAVGNVGPASPKASATFIAGYPYALKLTANPTEILADGVAISKITALVTDEWGRPVKDATVVLETNAGFIHPLTAVTGADGKAMVTLTASTTIETATVSAAVADYPEVTGTTTVEFVAQSFEIGLRVGWNLISLPLIPTDPDIKVVLEGVKGIEIVWAYDAVTERWLSWIPGRPDQFQTLKTMEDGLGFWVLMRAPATLTVEGFVMPPPPVIPPVYEVVAGWNLIGFRSLETTTTASDHLRGISWTVLWRFGAEGFVRVLPLHSMIPGAGYWLFAEEPGRIAIIENGK
ncbi:MAG: Alpha-amylase [Chloroflexi bacterium]|nr:Alpha-amylase [Chloroflexota bacterium]